MKTKKIIIIFLLFTLAISTSIFANNNLLNLLSNQQTTSQSPFYSNVTNGDLNYTDITLNIQTNNYLYKDKIKVYLDLKQININNLPPGIPHKDEFFGQSDIYRNKVSFSIPTDHNKEQSIILEYQGCSDNKICYPIERHTYNYFPDTNSWNLCIECDNNIVEDGESNDETNKKIELNNNLDTSYYSFLSGNLFEIFLFIPLGILIAFSPCILPMIPLIQSAVLNKTKNKQSNKRSFMLSLSYVQGMAISFSIMGLLVVFLGIQVQSFLQSNIILLTLSIIFFIFALSSFGIFEIRLPSYIRNIIYSNEQKITGGSISKSFLIGLFSGVIASPCVTAPLAAILIYLATTGNYIYGALSLYMLANGIGIPLLIIGIFGNHILPKTGNWLNYSKHIMGFILLLVAILFFNRALPPIVQNFSYIAYLALIVLYIFIVNIKSTKKAISLFILIIIFTSTSIYLFPSYLFTKNNQSQISGFVHKVNNLTEIDNLINNSSKPIIIDFYADWCIYCKEMEHTIFSKTDIQQLLKDKYTFIKIDVTKNTNESNKVLEKYQVIGLPTFIMINTDGSTFKHMSGLNKTNFINLISKLK